jgi:hypothetical protein
LPEICPYIGANKLFIMKKLFVLLVIVGASLNAFSQAQVSLGLKAGVNVSKLNSDDVETSSITAFHGGAFALFKLTKIGIQPELLFSQQGTTIDDVNFGKGDLEASYLTIPVMLRIYLAGGFSLNVGPQFGFLNSAEFKGNDADLKSSDITANVGVAWDAPFGLVLDARYNIGLSDVNDSDVISGEIKSNCFQFSVGYKIFKFGN